MSNDMTSPAPWRYTGDDSALCLVEDVAGNRLASVWTVADARLICLAVNAHADLLAACVLMLDRIDGSHPKVMYAVEVMRAAVAETPDG